MEHKLVIPEQTEVCLPPSKKLESQLYIASVKSICSYIKLTCLCAQSWTRRVKKLLQNQHSCFLLNSAYVYLLFSLIWFKCQYRDLPQLFQRKCYRYLIVCVELILPYFRETEMCVILKKLILLEGLSYWWASFNAKEHRWIFSNRLKNIPRNLSRIDFENETVHNASEELRSQWKIPSLKLFWIKESSCRLCCWIVLR